MLKAFRLVIKYLSNVPSKTADINDKLVVFPPNRVPKNIKVSDLMHFAHVSFDGDAEIIASYNVTAVHRQERGVFKILFDNPHATGKYTCVGSSGLGNHSSSGRTVSIDEMTTTYCTIRIERTDNGSNENEPYTSLVIF